MSEWIRVLAVGSGGFVGAVARYLISLGLQRATESASFPFGTLVVNVSGCLVIGLLAGLLTTRLVLSPELRLLIITGFLGALTTFSTFSLETVNLWRNGTYGLAALNLSGQLLLGVGGVWTGMWLANALAAR